jgi:hypothetical protein
VSRGIPPTDRGSMMGIRHRHGQRRDADSEDQEATVLWTVLKVELMLVPRLWIIVMQATMIRASITAYSTAVGPSSLERNRWILARFPII